MNLVSEMVLARNRLLSFARTSGDLAFNNTVRRIDTVTLELQERMMKTRMQPISQVWSKFPRLVRDIAQDCGKKVELIQIGAETELDRTLLEGIRDPLVHIIRNSIDHGIELPAERIAKGAVRDSLPVKVLGNGEIDVKVSVTAHAFSSSAVDKITAAGGKTNVL